MTLSSEEESSTEQDRLLSHENSQDDGLEEGAESFKSSPALTNIVLYFMAIHFLLAFCEMILVAPLIQLFENSLCLDHYGFPVGGVEELLCKVPEIQGPLATIRGLKSSFDTLPGMPSILERIEHALTYK
jgi:hypothetical protein